MTHWALILWLLRSSLAYSGYPVLLVRQPVSRGFFSWSGWC